MKEGRNKGRNKGKNKGTKEGTTEGRKEATWLQKRKNSYFCESMDGPGDYNAK